MIDRLENIDQQIVLFINGYHNSFADPIMWVLSGKWTLIPLYLLCAYFLWRKYNWRQFGIVVLGIALCVLLTDQISVHLFKEVFQRYRPSHNLYLRPLLYFHETKPGEFYRGGQYGFVSSHAANYFGFLAFVSASFIRAKKWFFTVLLLVGMLICWSRIYLGVHYLSDVMVGALLGILIGGLCWFIVNKYFLKEVK